MSQALSQGAVEGPFELVSVRYSGEVEDRPRRIRRGYPGTSNDFQTRLRQPMDDNAIALSFRRSRYLDELGAPTVKLPQERRGSMRRNCVSAERKTRPH